MTEAEVILNIALYYIKNGLTTENVKVSIDGAHIQTKNQIHFDIYSYMQKYGCLKADDITERWQGLYSITGCSPKLEICSTSGIGDINILLPNGELLWFECKKGKNNKSGQEYVLMREAIGQLMTNEYIPSNATPIVAVPYSEKSFNLATKWSALERIKEAGIHFLLVKNASDIVLI